MLLFMIKRADYDRAMGLGNFKKLSRRLASTFALVGLLLYTALVPGHVVSQAAALAHGGEPGIAAEMLCHDSIAVPHGPSAPEEPSAPSKQCPFCKGYASFMTSLAGACDADVLDAEQALPSLTVYDEGRAEYAALRPQNRGPPITL